MTDGHLLDVINRLSDPAQSTLKRLIGTNTCFILNIEQRCFCSSSTKLDCAYMAAEKTNNNF